MIKQKDKVSISGKYRFKIWDAKTGKLIRTTQWNKNLIVVNENSGLNIAVKNLLGNFTYNLEITKAKMGTGTATPNSNDTDLKNPVVDNIALANKNENSTSEVFLEFFISDAECPNGTYYEFGIFCGNRLFARSLISPALTKSTGQDITAEYTINFYNT